MKIVLFYHSLVSDWNHGNAHFLRGVVNALQKKGHTVSVYEPENGWSLRNLLQEKGSDRLLEFKKYYPTLQPLFYDPEKPLDAKTIFTGADLVIVHEWNSPHLIAEIGALKDRYGYRLLFHDTHHRSVSDPQAMARYDFTQYDGALVFGKIIKDIYQKNGWIQNVWTWHEAADSSLFSPPRKRSPTKGDLVWIGNWGDDERETELMEFLIEPIRQLGLKAKIYGVRYPDHVRRLLEKSGISYGGWLPNYKVPEVFAQYRMIVHVPRRPYVEMLPGIPTIRPFEALSCGIPLVSAPWKDEEKLFRRGKDYRMAGDGEEMKNHIKEILRHPHLADELSRNGRSTILQNHTCTHRSTELEVIAESIGIGSHKKQII